MKKLFAFFALIGFVASFFYMKRTSEPVATNVSARSPSAVIPPPVVQKDPVTQKITQVDKTEVKLSGATNKEKAENFVRLYAKELFQISPEDLVFDSETVSNRFVFQHKVKGHKVYGSTLTLFFEGEDFHLAKSRLTTLSAQESDSLDLSQSAAAPVLKNAINTPELVLYPHQGRGLWSFLAVIKEPGEQYWQVLVDAQSGQVISKIDMVKN